jgi:hypothetical protein
MRDYRLHRFRQWLRQNWDDNANRKNEQYVFLHFPGVVAAFVSNAELNKQALAAASASTTSNIGHSLDSGTTFSAALKPILEWVPSQNGFSVDAPQRQRAIRGSTGNLFPSASINSTSPFTM